jgi:hypothetical protein
MPASSNNPIAAFDRRGTEVHVPLRRRQVLVPGQLRRGNGVTALPLDALRDLIRQEGAPSPK